MLTFFPFLEPKLCFFKSKFVTLLLLYICVWSFSLQAQKPIFEVIHLPRIANYSKEKLNSELSSKTSKNQVKQFLKSRNFPNGTTVVIRINKSNNERTTWTIPLSDTPDNEDNFIILRSKDNATSSIYKLSDFKGLFKDTVAIVDTISVDLYIHDDNYPNDQYQLLTSCDGDSSTKKINIPFNNGKLVFTNSLISNCPAQPVAVTIINTGERDKILAACYLRFLTFEQKEILTDMASFYKEHQPEISSKERTQIVNNYATRHMGNLYFPQLVDLLNKTQQ